MGLREGWEVECLSPDCDEEKASMVVDGKSLTTLHWQEKLVGEWEWTVF